jgi:hypothetical protein
MDDGTKGGYGFRFCTEAYSLLDVELLLYALQDTYGLKCSLQSRRVPHRKRIYVSASSLPLFRSIVSPNSLGLCFCYDYMHCLIYMHSEPPVH